ncbi:transcriptional repressor [Pedobacter gandavensis]|uniref:transcriptional repressor n=1 Tax=Pedobacter gandavensis TaxID=2679963 RepID=UPI0039775D91
MGAKHGISKISKVILQYLEENDNALDAEALWLKLREQGHRMCVCSIYLNLKKLEKMKRLQKIENPERKSVYILNSE